MSLQTGINIAAPATRPSAMLADRGGRLAVAKAPCKTVNRWVKTAPVGRSTVLVLWNAC